MRVYSVHVRSHGLDPDRDMVLVREGFSWAATLITLPWALWHRLWLFSLVVLAVMTVSGILGRTFSVGPEVVGLMHLAIALICGLIGNDVRRHKLSRAGFEAVDVVSAPTLDRAERRFLDRNPRVAAHFSEGLVS